MPITISTTTGGTGYACPVVGPVIYTEQIKIDLSTLTTAEVDSDGYLKPGVVFDQAGTPVGSTEVVHGIVVEPTKLALVTIPPTNTSLAAETGDHLVTLCTFGMVNRDIAEDNMGRAYTANELAGFALAGSHLKLTTT